MDRNQLLKKKIQLAKSIAIISHVIPDADAYSSARVWQKYVESIKNKQAKVDIFIENNNEVAELYKPLFPQGSRKINQRALVNYDVAIALDCASLGRLGKNQKIFNNATWTANIDHHDTNPNFGDLNIVEQSSSTCEITYEILKSLKEPVTKGMASLIYAGIITDSLNLSVNNTQRTLEIVGELQGKVDSNMIRNWFFKNSTKAKAELIGNALSRIEYHWGDRMALMTIVQKDIQYSGAQFEDTLGIIDLASAVKDVDLAAMIIEKTPNFYYVSLRSKEDVDVLDIAKEFKGGGNNRNMGAFQFTGELEDLRRKLNTAAKHQLRISPTHSLSENPFAETEEKKENPVDVGKTDNDEGKS